MGELTAEVRAALDQETQEFSRRARAEVEGMVAEIDDGTFDNPQGALGLEYEFYTVADPSATGYSERRSTPCSLARVPRHLLNFIGFEKELGLHNAEMCTQPEPFNEYGLAAQEASVRGRLLAAREPARAAGLRIVSDGLWTIPPTGSTARSYLGASATRDGLLIASNMSESPRYHAIANTGSTEMALCVSVPHATIATDTIMPVALTTSIQPHYQVPRARSLPDYFRYALRSAAPLLALGVNSPLLPPDLYDDDASPSDILRDGWAEHRIPIFEGTLNPPTPSGPGCVGDPEAFAIDIHGEDRGKVRFPRDIETVRTALERIAADQTVVPMPVATSDRFDDEFAHFRLKHGTYWRWIRPVFGGATRSAANARIEFRPLPGQPTVRDTVAFQAAFGGLLAGLRHADHPVKDLDWRYARRNFYRVARDGMDADLQWIDSDGTEVTALDRIYADVFEFVRLGLEIQDFGADAIETYLAPLRARVEHKTTPADWKRDRVREAIEDGQPFADAVTRAQRAYIDRQRETLLTETFTSWLGAT